MGSTSVQAPDPLDYGAITRDTLQAQLDLAPEKYAAEAEFAPKYQALTMGLLQQSLPKLLDMYQNQVNPALSATEVASRRASRAGDIEDVSSLGPQAREAQRSYNPEAAGLVDAMVNQAQSGLDAGSNLTPDQQNRVSQGIRSQWADRGLALGPSSALDEVVRSQMMAAGEGDRRRGNAMQALGASEGFYGDQFQQILGRPSGAFGMTPGVVSQGQSFNPGQLFNPESQMSADFANQGYQGTLAARTATAGNSAAMIGAGMSAAGSAAGGGL